MQRLKCTWHAEKAHSPLRLAPRGWFLSEADGEWAEPHIQTDAIFKEKCVWASTVPAGKV